MEKHAVQTGIGWLEIRVVNEMVSQLVFLEKDSGQRAESPVVLKAKGQLNDYFEGKRQSFDLPLNPEGTKFQQEVWQWLQTMSYGTTVSYMDMAKSLGNPKTIRAVASANGANPIPIIIPCHRVIGSDGSLTGYAGGLKIKQQLLEIEGVLNQLSMF